jgi:hypothetical protein
LSVPVNKILDIITTETIKVHAKKVSIEIAGISSYSFLGRRGQSKCTCEEAL